MRSIDSVRCTRPVDDWYKPHSWISPLVGRPSLGSLSRIERVIHDICHPLWHFYGLRCQCKFEFRAASLAKRPFLVLRHRDFIVHWKGHGVPMPLLMMVSPVRASVGCGERKQSYRGWTGKKFPQWWCHDHIQSSPSWYLRFPKAMSAFNCPP